MPKKTRYPVSDHFDGEKFSNPWGVNVSKTFWDVLQWKWSTTPRPWPEDDVPNVATPRLLAPGTAASIHITYIGHATTLIQNEQWNILTDPQFSDRASPVRFAGPRRIRKPGVEFAALPRIHFVVISHNHFDHLDLPSLRQLEERDHPHFVVPLGNGELLRGEGFSQVTELDWWETLRDPRLSADQGSIRLVPAQHWSARSVGDRNEALWGAYVVALSGRKIYFAGDTGYGPHFQMARERLGGMDVSLLPIGAYEPRWFMKDQHMNPADAVKAHQDLGAKTSLAIHFETFRLTDEAFEEPRLELQRQLQKARLDAGCFLAPQVGETWILHSP